MSRHNKKEAIYVINVTLIDSLHRKLTMASLKQMHFVIAFFASLQIYLICQWNYHTTNLYNLSMQYIPNDYNDCNNRCDIYSRYNFS